MPEIVLTNIGHKALLGLVADGAADSPEVQRLSKVATAGVLLLPSDALTEQLLQKKWVVISDQHLNPEMVFTRYQRNPLEHVSRINYEVTTLCNFNCLHCRNDGVEMTTDLDTDALKRAGELFLSIGIRRYDFIGGEVSKFGTGWLEIAQHLHESDARLKWHTPLSVSLYTNGWWLEETQFLAAGKTYASESDYLDDLREHGVTHILFSIDGPEQVHDEWRKHTGLFRKVLTALRRVREAGIKPRLSIVRRPDEDLSYLRPFAEEMYPQVAGDRFHALKSDPMNHISNFIDIGRGSELRTGRYDVHSVPPDLIRCKAFFRPSPTLRIMANGEVGICPLMHGREAYGNIHQGELPDILNSLQDSVLFKLHAENRIGTFLKRLDPQEFKDGFDHLCAVRIAVNRLALSQELGSI